MNHALAISAATSIDSGFTAQRSEDSVVETLEACWLRELRRAYLALGRRLLLRAALSFVLFVSGWLSVHAFSAALSVSIAAIEPSSTIDTGVSCDQPSGCRYLV